jgi:hypothetical protein
MGEKIKLGIRSSLLGEPYRYDVGKYNEPLCYAPALSQSPSGGFDAQESYLTKMNVLFTLA